MCGISGFYQYHASDTATHRTLDRMLDAIFHRGPDEWGKVQDGPLQMGMRRLSIIDLADGKQPIYSEDERYVVVFNGEIYNYQELRSQLISRGHRLKTQSDTEVIVHLYEDYGPQCVEHLRGMFGFAVWDTRDRKLFIARDRLGIKPLYYCELDGELVFSSEIKSILQHPKVSPTLDHDALSAYLSLKYVPAPLTFFEGIRSLPPAHAMVVDGNGVNIQRYWDYDFDKSNAPQTIEDATDRLEEVLSESVRMRLQCDVPFGAFLSGGIDSSIIVAMMSRELSQPVQTFSVGFDGGDEPDELPYARMVAKKFGCQHHEIVVTADDFIRGAEDVIYHLDQPIADQATVATNMVAKLARQHVKMVLTGEGGDELFAGYARYGGDRLKRYFQPVPAFALQGLRRAVHSLPGLRRQKIAFNALSYKEEDQRLASWFPLFHDDMKRQVLSSAMGAYAGSAREHFENALNRCKGTDSLDRMLYADTALWLPDYLLLRGDKLTMANSLEGRVPFLDHHLVEFAASLRPEWKLHGNQRKYVLKRVAARYLPSEIIHRKKQGFPIPIDQWMRAQAKPVIRDLLSTDAVQRRGLFNPQMVEGLLAKHESGKFDYATEIWGLASVELWMRRFLDQSVRISSEANTSCEVGVNPAAFTTPVTGEATKLSAGGTSRPGPPEPSRNVVSHTTARPFTVTNCKLRMVKNPRSRVCSQTLYHPRAEGCS